jgi:hypothetical protein
MVCLSIEDAKKYGVEFNSRNTSETAPEWYMQVEGEPESIELTEKQMEYLKENNRVWLYNLNKMRE